MFGEFPVIFFALRQLLTQAEAEEILKLRQKSPLKTEEIVKLDALEKKASIQQSISFMTPFVIDGEIVPAQVTDSSAQMNKTISLLSGEYEISPSINTTTINIVSVAEEFTGLISDILFMMADLAFQRMIDKAPSIAFFGGSVAIPSGFLVGIAHGVQNNTNRQTISLTIARSLDNNLIIEGEPKVAEVAEVTERYL